ncbi:MAG: serine protease [Roseibium sp.]|uniref:S1 family peptidase n=1 Tax=Roseibium sp. TaxID=1936156 RepID=UPI00261A700E|nr:serine protease [Roseibium sp.]MCV0428669.1 serine protease [Roseibium sp.]
MKNRSLIDVRTNEVDLDGRRDWALSPDHGDDPEGRYFLVQDPFNIRKAVIPVFYGERDGSLRGLGTAFGISRDGILLTADHVISELRVRSRNTNSGNKNPTFENPHGEALCVFLSPGLVYGTHGITTEFFPNIVSVRTPIKAGDDPLKNLRGEDNFTPADVSVLKTQPLSAELHTLPLHLRPDYPKVGDQVVAIGYPQIDSIREEMPRFVNRVTEGMYASYGHVTAIHPDGRDKANGTPVFEVDANWPSGMSGGPVLNAHGKVIGLVSRSLEASDEHPGVGWAVWLGRLPEVGHAVRQTIFS